MNPLYEEVSENHKSTNFTKLTPISDEKYISFYQFCQEKNPHTKKYQTRKIIFGQGGNILKTYVSEYSAKQIQKFQSVHPTNKYAMYPTDNISMVAMPNSGDCMTATSLLLK
jgi:hypothetical protein